MKNRILGLMAAAAALGGMTLPAQMQGPQRMAGVQVPGPLSPQAQGGMQAPQGGIGTMLQAMLGHGGMSGGPTRINYRRGGYSVAHGKRMARKRRNQLRSKGLHKQAVR